MSVETIGLFWQKARQDPALQQQLAPLWGQDWPVARAAVVQIAAAAGFAFTAEAYEAAVQEELARQHADGRLTDLQLEKAAGGNAVGGVPIGSAPTGSIQS